MTNTLRVLGLALALGLLGAAAGRAQEAPKKPLSESDVTKMVKAQLDEDVIVGLIKKRGVSFPVDDAALGRLKKAGASQAVLAALPRDDGDAEPGKPLAAARHARGLIVEVLEVRPDANKNLLTIRWRYRNPTRRTIELIGRSARFVGTETRASTQFLDSIYYLEGNKQDQEVYRCSIVKDTGGKLWCTPITRDGVQVKAGESFEFWAKFEVPEASTRKITLHLLDTPPIEDIPVQKKK
jgi:hypothetical protein